MFMEMQREQLESSRGVSKRDRAWGMIPSQHSQAGAAGIAAQGLSWSAGAQCRPGRNQDTPRGGRMASLGIDKRDPAGPRLRGLAANTGCAAKGRKGHHTEPRAKQIRGPWWCLGENQKCSSRARRVTDIWLLGVSLELGLRENI